MIDIKRSHLIAATSVPLGIILIAVVLVLIRGHAPAQIGRGAEASDRAEDPAEGRGRTGPQGRDAADRAGALAVTADGVDRIGTTLDALGAGYRYRVVEDEVLDDLEALRKFRVVFLTCARAGAGGGLSSLAKALREYVTGGGTLYASDLRYDALAAAFPEFRDPASVAQGVPQDLRAEVASPELRAWVGREVGLRFRSDRWRPAAFRGDDVSVLLKGRLKTTAGVTIDAPLAVRFPVGKGTVLFTSFHVEGDAGEREAMLMKFLALKAVTSAPEARMLDSLADDGFSPGAIWAEAVDAGASPASHVYQHQRRGPLRFRLAPDRPGARLRLEVVGPGGRVQKEGDSLLAIDLPNAGAGRWQIRAAAESAPYPAFPAVVAVGVPGGRSSASSRKNPGLVGTSANVQFQRISLNQPAASRRARPLRIAVTEPQFDDMGRLLKALGQGYQYTEIPDDQLLQPAGLDRFDILFLTCGGWPISWGTKTSSLAIRPGLGEGEMRPDVMQRIRRNLGRFVERGGTLYVSDLRSEFIFYAFPERAPDDVFDLERLKDIEDAERKLFKIVVPAAGIETVSQTIDRLKLSENLRARRNELLAILNLSVVAKIYKPAGDADDLTSIRSLIERFGLPATEADCTTIAAEFESRRLKIQEAINGRSKTKLSKVRGEYNRLEAFLKGQRERLIVQFAGAGGQVVDAQVVDSGLHEAIGPTIRLNFPANAWDPGRFGGEGQVLIRGSYVTIRRDRVEGPLLVRFRQGQGTVIFTSFHNEGQNSQQELQLLRYVVFSAVTAKEEAVAQQTMLSGGFSPVKQGQVNHAMGKDSITRKYQSANGDPLRFALNFGGGGALLRLTVVAPGGARFEEDTEKSLLVEARGAPAGEWLYTVTAVKVPYENFAYSVSIGQGTPDQPPRRD